MEQLRKEAYAEPTLVMHDMLRDITAQSSGQKTSDKVREVIID